MSDRDVVQVARWSAIKCKVGTSLRELRQGQHAGDATAFGSRSQARLAGELEELGYHVTQSMVSRYEQGLLEARIRTLRARLDGAQIVEGAGAGEVGVGSVVDIAGDGGQSMTVEISAVGGTGTVSPTSPLGSALLGKKLGDSVDVQAPKGPWKATIKLIH